MNHTEKEISLPMDSSGMNLDVYNTSIQYKDRIYNDTPSGVIAQQSKFLNEMHTANALPNRNLLLQTNGSAEEHMLFDQENYVIEHFESSNNKSPGYEIITVDPNCFYSSDDDDIIVDIESDQSDTNGELDSESSASSDKRDQYPLMAQPIVLRSFEQLSTPTTMEDTSSFDISNVNINDLCAVDDHLLNTHDDILFANGSSDLSQFDLANYVDGGSSSLLLSPLAPTMPLARQRTPLKVSPAKTAVAALNRSDVHREENDSLASNDRKKPQLHSTAQPNTAANATNGNRRKRKNLTKAFIDTTDSDSENEATQNQEKIQQTKKQRRKDDDPVWDPMPNCNSKISGKFKNDATKSKVSSVATKSEEVCKEKRNDKPKLPPTTSSSTAGPSNGLRMLLKKQLLSSRPMKINPLKTSNKVLTMPTKPSTSHPNAVATKRKFGVGRGKDISITAKYFNSSAQSSDNSDRDNTNDDNLDVQNSSESESDASEISVRSKKWDNDLENPNSKCVKDKDTNVTVTTKNSVAEQIVTSNTKEVKSTSKVSTNGPVLLENVDFAKAIFVDAKEAAKVKPARREDIMKSISEQPIKRLPILFNNGNKFKTNCLPVLASSRPFTELRMTNGNPILQKAKSWTDVCPKPEVKLPKIPLRRQVTVEPKIEENCMEEVKMEIDVVSVDDDKFDATASVMAKKKLNIQEYLKRKNINPLVSGKMKICRDEHSYGKPAETAPKPVADENELASNSVSSLYEEIVSVSMGCGTDISIPELRVDSISNASKSTVLLSKIQTTIEKAHAAIEHGRISSNSLISSIQDVILKKTTVKVETPDCADDAKPTVKNEGHEHGENKVIMHLRKDRIRPKTITIAIQTDPYFQFPPLERLAPISRGNEHFNRCKSLGRSSVAIATAHDARSLRAHSIQLDRYANRNYRTQKDHIESSYYSDEDAHPQMSSPQRRSRHSEYLESIAHPSTLMNSHSQVRRRHKRSDSYKNNRRYRSSKFDRDTNRHRTISRSLSQSSDTSSSSHISTTTTSSSATASSASTKSFNSYGDSSAKSYYDDEHCDRRHNRSAQNWPRARNQQMSNHRSDSPENRRIVYVGRIESETTKDDLRRIFSVYGRVENVTIHYKEMKWKYGFVTFERPADAYKVIDTSTKDPAIKDYDISFGGRRAFCREKYFDLDNTEDDYSQSMHPLNKQSQRKDDSFEALLRSLKEKLRDTKE